MKDTTKSRFGSFLETVETRNLSGLEDNVIAYWKKEKIFEKSVDQKDSNNLYSFYDGPPFVTGLPHYGSLLSSIAKDVVPRYWTMKGKKIRRVWGWDCHGLPIEEKTEKKIGLKNRRDIESFGIDKFINECRNYVSETSSEWGWYIDKIGRWVDMEHSYKTMDLSFMESVIWAFKQLYEKGLVYEGDKTLLYCTRCGTPISKFEIAMDNSYEDTEDDAVTIAFKVVSESEFKNKYVLAWTTTPWTLPSNRALVVHKDEEYVEFNVVGDDKTYICAKKRLEFVCEGKEYTVVNQFKGSKLLGLRYEPLYTFLKSNENDFKVYHFEGMVTMDEGTGVVHSAPGFGEIDTEMGKANNLTFADTINDLGGYIDEITPWKGIYIKDANPLIMKDLEGRGLLFRKEKYLHSYPFCYRCHTPLIYRLVKAWFINIQKFKEKMLELNEDITWIPENLKHGRFASIIKDAPDWCVSRTRYWATAMPVWKCESCGEIKVVGSVKEIEESSIEKVKITDLHRNSVDNVKFKCKKCGGIMSRISEVLDCWFESGSMPYGERHYPFENKEDFEKAFPADYIVEYIAQTRAWFYYLHALSTMIFNKNCFKNVVTTGVIAGTDGRKMSKSFHNFPDPKDILTKYGGDALRLYLMSSVVMIGENINMTTGGEVQDQLKLILIPFLNTVKYLQTYAQAFNWKPTSLIYSSKNDNILDKWIVARFKRFLKSFDDYMQKYTIPNAVKEIQPFINDLSTWYIRRSRDRFVNGDTAAFETLYYVLVQFIKAVAPVIPFVTEYVYHKIVLSNFEDEAESVHLCDYPEVKDLTKEEVELLDQMSKTRVYCSLGQSIRIANKIKLKQPLLKAYVDKNCLPSWSIEVLKDELNVKEIDDINDNLGKNIKTDTIVANNNNENIELKLGLNIEINEELKEEGMIREFIRSVQALRKDKGFQYSDEIGLHVGCNDSKFVDILNQNKNDWMKVLKVKNLSWESDGGSDIDISGVRLNIKIIKV